MSWIKWAVTHIAPVFLVTSPVTSYADQIWSITQSRSSAGFSLDIPLIMLVASILKIFFWVGDRYDLPLLIQAGVMVAVQLVLLRAALLHRPRLHHPFQGAHQPDGSRPYHFWQWRAQRPYWHFVLSYTTALAVLQLLLGRNTAYVALQGYAALSVEAVLPIPQILENERLRSCRGFRLSVLVNWLVGDAFKMTYFFLSGGAVPWAFKLCALFQAACDCYLGVQYCMYGAGGDRPPANVDDKIPRLA